MLCKIQCLSADKLILQILRYYPSRSSCSIHYGNECTKPEVIDHRASFQTELKDREMWRFWVCRALILLQVYDLCLVPALGKTFKTNTLKKEKIFKTSLRT